MIYDNDPPVDTPVDKRDLMQIINDMSFLSEILIIFIKYYCTLYELRTINLNHNHVETETETEIEKVIREFKHRDMTFKIVKNVDDGIYDIFNNNKRNTDGRNKRAQKIPKIEVVVDEDISVEEEEEERRKRGEKNLTSARAAAPLPGGSPKAVRTL